MVSAIEKYSFYGRYVFVYSKLGMFEQHLN